MKNLLLCLLFLIIAPAWAEVAAVAPSASKLMAKETTPVAETGIVMELNGEPKEIAALLAGLEKQAVYKDAACITGPAAKDGKSAQISCAKTDGSLLIYLGKNANEVYWKIYAARACPAGCVVMPCPITYKCCRLTTHQPCY